MAERHGDESRQPAPDPSGLSGRVVSHFRVLEALGAGGMGVVYRAEDLRLHRTVALKFMLPQHTVDEAASARFLREARAVAALDHSNICTVHEVGESEEGHLFLAMTHYTGETLKDRLARTGPLPVAAAIDVASQVARGLACAHAAGIVHRDLKPANLMLAGDGTVKILDFGLAKARDQTMTGSGVVMGTVAYMSPEQLIGDRVDVRTDLWSLGVVLVEMMTGRHPFRGIAAKILTQHLETELGRAVPREIAVGLTRLVERLLQQDPAERYQSANDVLVDLDAVRERVALAAPSSGRARRSLRTWIVGGSVAAAVIAASVFAAVQWRGASGVGEGPPVVASAATPMVSSLAVLPLRNYGGNPDQEYFADGMTEELTTTLAKIEALRVIAHQSVLQFKRSERPMPEIARLLDVKYIVEGSVLQEGDRIRITANLIDVAANSRLWGESFERERRDVMALQREVALAVAQAIEVALTPQDRARLAATPTVNPKAFELYIKGTQARYAANFTGDFREATRYLERAVAEDSGYAPAYAGLAFIHAFTGDKARAQRYAAKAVRLDPQLSDAHMVVGMIRQFFDWDWVGAETAFRQAIALSPGGHAEAHHELSMLLLRRRRFDEALREGLLAWNLAPTSARFEQGLGEIYVFNEQYEEGLAIARKLLASDSALSGGYRLLGLAYLKQRKFNEAAKAWQDCLRLAPGCDDALAQLAYIDAMTGRRAEAMKVVDTLKARWRAERGRATASGIAMDLAIVYAGLRETEQALAWLERATETHAFMNYVGIEPTYQSLRAEPRFKAVLKKIGLPE